MEFYCSDGKGLSGTQKMSLAEAKAFCERKQTEKARAAGASGKKKGRK